MGLTEANVKVDAVRDVILDGVTFDGKVAAVEFLTSSIRQYVLGSSHQTSAAAGDTRPSSCNENNVCNLQQKTASPKHKG